MLRTHRGPRTDRLVVACAHRGVSLALAAAIAVTDHVVHQQQLPFLARGLMDEPCHLATAMIALGALTRWRGRPPGSRFVWAMLSASVLVDLDHLPLELGSAVLTAGTPRPYTHALWVLVLLTVAAAAARRRRQVSGSARARTVAGIAAGAAWGVAAHFLRDVGTAPIALWWPVSSASVQVPGYWYLAALFVLATLPPPRTQP
ncbi:MAG TPA: metal-dependent hydrolase [Streptosporangiaceae bacterium]